MQQPWRDTWQSRGSSWERGLILCSSIRRVSRRFNWPFDTRRRRSPITWGIKWECEPHLVSDTSSILILPYRESRDIVRRARLKDHNVSKQDLAYTNSVVKKSSLVLKSIRVLLLIKECYIIMFKFEKLFYYFIIYIIKECYIHIKNAKHNIYLFMTDKTLIDTENWAILFHALLYIT